MQKLCLNVNHICVECSYIFANVQGHEHEQIYYL
jgi:rubredoxin